MREELLEQARTAVDMAKQAGADDAVVGVSRGRSIDFAWREGKLEKVQEDTSRGLGLNLYVDGRFSRHSTNDLDPDRLRPFIAEAVALTRLLEVDPFRKITDPKLYEGRQDIDLDLVDASLVNLTREVRTQWCQELADAASAHDDVISATSGVANAHGVSARVSSNGFEGASEGSSVWYGSEVTVSDGPTKRPEAWWWVGGSHLEGLPSPKETGAEALRRVLARRGATKAPSSKTTMVVDPEAGASLMGRIFGAMSAGAIQQKRSYLADQLGKSITSDVLTLTDDPFRPRMGASRLWDGEGIATKKRTVIEGGVLKTFYVDTYYGRKLGWEPTTGSPSNIVFEGGKGDLASMLGDVGEGLYVNSWLGGNANMTTGDFSFGLRGHVIRDGALAEPISEMNVTGNYAELLQKLVRVGDDPVPWSTFRTPTLVFEGIQFSGA
ncbi:MAG: TldD/PmbA family protein [Proteobacteria bacterium]|nr:TldD/PmbA family protein [Pseudomonadota bacterium]